MTLNDLLRRTSEQDKDKMLLFRDGKGWSNINIEIKENEIAITCDKNEIFSDDKC